MTVAWLLSAIDSALLIRLFEFSESSFLSQIVCGKARGDITSSSTRTDTSKNTSKNNTKKEGPSHLSHASSSGFGDIALQVGHESDEVSYADVATDPEKGGLQIEME